MNTVSRLIPARSVALKCRVPSWLRMYAGQCLSPAKIDNLVTAQPFSQHERVAGGEASDYDTPTPSKHRGSSLDALLTHVETGWSVIASAG